MLSLTKDDRTLASQKTKTFDLDSRVVEAKRRLGLIIRNLTGYLDDVVVENPTDKVEVAKYERFLEIEADGDNVFGVASTEPPYVLYLELMFEQEFLVV